MHTLSCSSSRLSDASSYIHSQSSLCMIMEAQPPGLTSLLGEQDLDTSVAASTEQRSFCIKLSDVLY